VWEFLASQVVFKIEDDPVKRICAKRGVNSNELLHCSVAVVAGRNGSVDHAVGCGGDCWEASV